jgi:hypothetical protein
MTKRIHELVSVGGILIQVIGFVAFFRDVMTNPLYAIILLIFGYAVTLTACLIRIMKKETKASRFMDLNQAPIKSSQYVFSPRQRQIAMGILIVGTLATVLSGFGIRKLSENPVPEDLPDLTETPAAVFSYVRINRIYWMGAGAVAKANGKRYPLARIIDTTEMSIMSEFTGTACALAFEIETRSDIDRVAIDKFEVVVDNYKPLPVYEPQFPAPFGEANVVYLEIDNPSLSKTNVFLATKKVEDGKVKDIGLVSLVKGTPETFIMRVNARRPGIYTIDCRMVVRYKNSTETVGLLKDPKPWFFDH